MSIKIISRGKGKSAVAAAAYRAGEKITNEYDGLTHDYTRKGGVAHTEILLPDHAPQEYLDCATLWNAVGYPVYCLIGFPGQKHHFSQIRKSSLCEWHKLL